jgi:outer membrane protein assembly factor BamB
MVDRHLRGPAPLCDSGRLVVPGENCLIGVDAYNGSERWHLDLPPSQRYTTPYDAGYMSLLGDAIYVAVNQECWQIHADTGKRLRTWRAPVDSDATYWGYLYADQTGLFGSLQFASASRTEPSRQLIVDDYNHDQPLVTSRALFFMDRQAGGVKWMYGNTVIANPTITIADQQVFFVESRNPDALDDHTGRLKLETLLAADALVTALDAKSGEVKWQVPIPPQLADVRSMLYMQCANDLLLAIGSYRSDANDTRYQLAAFRVDDGELVWSAEHAEEKPGAFTHGEQVHHPVLLGSTLIAEPVMYDATTGERTGLDALGKSWRLVRPGHSCGTMSGAGQCVFFRANNPTVLDIGDRPAAGQRMQKLAPTRPGCWINIIPASGLVLIPEASASCVCHYSLQTSMAFRPVPHEAN